MEQRFKVPHVKFSLFLDLMIRKKVTAWADAVLHGFTQAQIHTAYNAA